MHAPREAEESIPRKALVNDLISKTYPEIVDFARCWLRRFRLVPVLDAEDALQEAYVRILEHIKDFHGTTSEEFSPWGKRFVHLCFKNLMRRQLVERRFSGAGLLLDELKTVEGEEPAATRPLKAFSKKRKGWL
jgi:DNA-directed RNA polymerase specialized sigma24 family protein